MPERPATRAAALLLALAAASTFTGNAAQVAPVPISLDRDDIGGTVTGDEGAEAGVWVIAETDQLPTRFTRMVVTDDEGRYVLPDLPAATYDVFVRGYGLADSARVRARPGQRLDLTASTAESEPLQALVYPAAYWLTVMRVPPTGPIHPAVLTRTMKRCMACHQLGDAATRQVPAGLDTAAEHLAAWDERMKRGPDTNVMSAPFAALRGQRTMFSEWTERIAAGRSPLETPPRPRGVERNVVVTLWDWGGPTTSRAAAAIGPAASAAQAKARIYGASPYEDALLWVDPASYEAGSVKVPSSAATSQGMQSPRFGDERIWRAAAQPAAAMVDGGGRVWFATRFPAANEGPSFCGDPANPFAAHSRLGGRAGQVSMFDPASGRFRHFDTCFIPTRADLAPDGRLYFGAVDAIGWIDTRAAVASEATGDASIQGWCPLVIDTNGDGRITAGWTEPDQPVDPARDHRIEYTCGQTAVAPDGSVWCGSGGVDDERILRIEIGAAAPASCRAEVFAAPKWRDVAGPRTVAVDSDGVVWVNMAATDHLASFDRRKCTRLAGPGALGEHCSEGWQFHPIPGPSYSIAAPNAAGDVVLRGALTARTTDLMHTVIVDRRDVLGLNGGADVPLVLLSNSDAVLAFLPSAREFVTLRVPYPLGFYGRSLHPQVETADAGWKGRGLWSSYASGAGWHVEGGPGVRRKVVKLQLRPDPLAR